ncbi:hypothetical protein DH2020_044608 [Rehmannia glutinosa]|uniref:Uncharacterized protein n=1 Tax=Rehmannia glutinosa TaxID=99300 RepID=A0ABR0UGF5_REHGL
MDFISPDCSRSLVRKRISIHFVKPANAIISKLEEVAKRMKLKINKKDGGLFRFEGSKEGRKGKLCVDAEIFLLTPEIHLVEVKKTSGDTLEYEKILDEGIRPGLQDIVWSSQDESQPQQRYEQLEVQNGHPQPLLSQDQQIQHVNRQLEPLEQKPLLQDRKMVTWNASDTHVVSYLAWIGDG